MNGNFSRFCLEYLAFYAYNITYIIFLKICIRLFSNAVPRHI